MTSAPLDGQTGINVTATFFPMLWILYFIKPKVVIDGVETPGQWKQPMFFPTAPGTHQVEVFYPYFAPKQAGKGMSTVSVGPGQVVNVGYRAPWLVFLKAKLTLG